MLLVAPALACGVALESPAGAAAQAPVQPVPEDPPPQELAIGEGVVRLAGTPACPRGVAWKGLAR